MQKVIRLFHIIKYRVKIQRIRILCIRRDKLKIPKGSEEIRLFCIARNEALRLPYFLKYYSEMGVDRIFLIDNNSDDDTVGIALSYPNVHVFTINESFKKSWFWMEFFLDKYGKNRWCFVVDIDELFTYPFSEILSLNNLIKYLESNKYNAIISFLLDMYSKNPIPSINYKAGENPLVHCPYFDRKYYSFNEIIMDNKKMESFTAKIFSGGMRNRIFNNDSFQFFLSKISFYKNTRNSNLTRGMHAINGAKIADISGVVFHTKFMQDFVKEAAQEAKREVHHNNATDYKIYDKVCRHNPNLNLHFEDSVKLKNTRQLVKLDLMKTSETYVNFIVEKNIDVTPLIENNFT